MNDTTSQGLQSVSRIHPDMNTQRTHGLQLLVFQIDTSMNLFTGVPWVIWVISQLWKNWCVQWFGVWRTSSLFWSRIMSKPWDWLIHTRHINRNTRIPGVVRIFTNFHQCRSVWNGRSWKVLLQTCHNYQAKTGWLVPLFHSKGHASRNWVQTRQKSVQVQVETVGWFDWPALVSVRLPNRLTDMQAMVDWNKWLQQTAYKLFGNRTAAHDV